MVAEALRSARRLTPRILVVSVVLAATVVAVRGTSSQATEDVVVERLAGTDRYATAVAVAADAFASAGEVVLASGENFPDALAASFLAGALQGPVLLTETAALPDAVGTELARLGATTVHVAGGTTAVSAAVEDDLRARGLTVRRVAGGNRYETARMVAEAASQQVGVLPDRGRTAIVVTGERFPDALVGGSAAFRGGMPVLLTPPQELHAEAAAALSSLAIDHVVVLGGEAAVSSSVVGEIESMGVSTERVAGQDRTDTAARFAEWAIAELGFTAGHVNLARGDTFPDAIAGGPHSGREAAPILLTTNPDVLGSATGAFLSAHAAEVALIHVFGGPAAVSDATAAAAREAAGGPPTDVPFSPFVAPQEGAVVELAPHEGPPEGPEASSRPAAEPVEGPVSDDEPDPDQDPCSLVPVGDFAAWVGASTADQHPLETGDACGYTGGDDTLRMALALIDRGTDIGWLPPDQPHVELSVAGHPAQWAPDYPVPESAVLVVELDAHELVIEVSSRHSQHTESFMRDGAVDFATTAIGSYQP